MWGDIDTYNTTSSVHPVIYQDTDSVEHITSFSITGGGTIDGQGWRWWPFLKTRPRPFLISLKQASNVFINDTIFKNSPSWNMELRGNNITVSHVRIEANLEGCGGWETAPNTDGIHASGTGIRIHDVWVHNGDDCVAIDTEGVTSDVLVERVHCECGTNGAVTFVSGPRSPAPGGQGMTVRDMLFRDMVVNHTNQGAGIKIAEAYENVTGQIYNVTWDNIHIINPRNAIAYINVFEEDASSGQCKLPSNPARPHWLTAQNITFRNIVAETSTYAGCFMCSPTRPCEGLSMDNVTVTGESSGYRCFNAHGSSEGASPTPCFDSMH